MKIKVPFLKVALILFASLITTWASAQVATTDVSVNDSLYIVKLTQSNGLYTVTYSLDGKVKLSKKSANFGSTYVYNHLKELWCHKPANASSKPNGTDASQDTTHQTQNPSDSASTSNQAETPTDAEEASTTKQTPCTLSDTVIRELTNKANKCFIDLIFAFANDSEAKGQKVANISFETRIPVYNVIRLRTLEKGETLESIKKQPIKVNGKVVKPETMYLNRRWPRKDLLMANVEETLIAESCDIVFENGFISSIYVSGKIGEKDVRFSNKYGIGVTTRQNIKDFSLICLYDELGNEDRYLRLNEVIEYSRLVSNYTRDYSPADTTINLTLNKQTKPIFKSPSTKLFQLNIFSDFVGINEDNPNGLVQLEVDKRINIWTKRVRRLSWFTFLNPYFEWSKIEQHNRALQFSDVDGKYVVSPLEVYRYSMIETGAPLNIVDYDGSVIHFQGNLVSALTFTQLNDSISQGGGDIKYVNERINSFLLGGELKCIFSPEKSWNFTISSRMFKYWNLNSSVLYNSIDQSVEKPNLVPPKNWLNDFSMLVTIRTGSKSDNLFFARLGFIHELGNVRNNFSQIQLGYSIYLKTSRKN